LEFVDRLDSDFADNRHEHQVALELGAAVLDCFGGEQPGGHGPFVIDDAVPQQQVAVAPAVWKTGSAARRVTHHSSL
jgi:hypothetical protein